jgi:hypothetical protein
MPNVIIQSNKSKQTNDQLEGLLLPLQPDFSETMVSQILQSQDSQQWLNYTLHSTNQVLGRRRRTITELGIATARGATTNRDTRLSRSKLGPFRRSLQEKENYPQAHNDPETRISVPLSSRSSGTSLESTTDSCLQVESRPQALTSGSYVCNDSRRQSTPLFSDPEDSDDIIYIGCKKKVYAEAEPALAQVNNPRKKRVRLA